MSLDNPEVRLRVRIIAGMPSSCLKNALPAFRAGAFSWNLLDESERGCYPFDVAAELIQSGSLMVERLAVYGSQEGGNHVGLVP